ncbi:MAG: endonuclease domain-containing protein [Gracilimonas sp.]
MNKNQSFHYYNKGLKPISKVLRKSLTKAEASLWKYGLSKKKRKGYTFNRQRPVLNYVADFMCKKLELIIEVDGSSHDHEKAQERDRIREDNLKAAGFTVLRFTNEDVLKNMDAVCDRIDREIVVLGRRKS